ncbi:hypothetical protein BLA60_18445 [Actinophytocola xinjiangensis]|uniref:Uncharacterized protein n=1 Tax=Actinophytocola xinjiangensis TaxID=485602 RepID=A0A7Z1AX59_9PSEU|nr:hypothetical protein [Actinophytocola xinjiangensis]OLF09760.1 hypothetical protein BLA60_18445 [Actinophytocola xinjiangensis]
MRSGAASRARQILLLCALALSVLGMHHVAAPSHAAGPAMTVEAMTVEAPTVEPPAGDHQPDTGHDLLHLCLVVLSAAVLLLVGWGLATTFPTGATRAGRPPAFSRTRVVAGRSLLTSVCVLRL